jgi:RND family efflux transporter MFP subunit
LTVLLVAGLVALLAFVFRDRLLPSTPIEVDPWPIKVATLVDGFVEDVFVREGEAVTNGQLLARLDAADAELALAEAEADVTAAAARVVEARDRWERIQGLSLNDIAAADRVKAQSVFKEAEGKAAATRARRDAAQLALTRTTIHAPMDGIVLKRHVEPGSKRMRDMENEDSAVIVSLFDPGHLQVRVDVPLAEAGRLETGQPTRISTAMLPGQVFTGTVTRIVGEADLQRNTLQAKVAVHTPDARMRPDVLCRVEFWSRPDSDVAIAPGGHARRRTLWVPTAALGDASATEQNVWVVDALTMTATRRTVALGNLTTDGLQLVREGLHVNEMVVTSDTSGLKEGQRVRIAAGEDTP